MGGSFPVALCHPIAAPRRAKTCPIPKAMALATVHTSASLQFVSSDSGFAGGFRDVTAFQPIVIERSITTLASIAAPAPTAIHMSWS